MFHIFIKHAWVSTLPPEFLNFHSTTGTYLFVLNTDNEHKFSFTYSPQLELALIYVYFTKELDFITSKRISKIYNYRSNE